MNTTDVKAPRNEKIETTLASELDTVVFLLDAILDGDVSGVIVPRMLRNAASACERAAEQLERKYQR